MLRGSNLSEDVGQRLLDSQLVFLDPELAATFERSTTKIGDLVFTCWGTIGQLGLIDSTSAFQNYVVSNKQMKLSPDPDQVDSLFLYYNLSQPSMMNTVKSRAIGSTIPGFNLGQLKAIEVQLPSLAEQRAIAEVLGALDDKIAANTKLAETAEALSQAVFRSIVGDALSAPLSATARFVNGKAFTKGASGTGRVVIRIAELNSGLGGSTVFSDAEVGDDFLARPGDILFAWSGSLTLHRWFRSEGIVNQHIFKVVPNGYPSWLVYELLRDRLTYFKGIAADKATTMGHIQRGHLDELVYVPSRSSIDRVDELMTSLWDRTLLAERENETLAATRDALLPQLMSGILRVRDAQTYIEELV